MYQRTNISIGVELFFAFYVFIRLQTMVLGNFVQWNEDDVVNDTNRVHL